jgi:pimeloyl-ACP methyl ester carboxylesterase
LDGAVTIIREMPLASGVVHVESNGDPIGRLVLCVHGLSANCRSFDRLVPVLAAAGHHVVTMDLRGRGRSEISPPGSYGWDSHVRDLLEIADFYGADSFDVVGHSMGAFIGMTLAAQYRRRCRRLVLIDGLGAPEPSALQSIAQSVGRLGRTYPSTAAALSYVRSSGAISPWNEFWDNYIEWELEPAGESAVGIRTDLAAVSEDSVDAGKHDVYRLWPRFRCPVLLIRAGKPLAPHGGMIVSAEDAERFAADTRNATVVEVDADHYTVLVDPIAVDAVERFLRT